ncbi:MAG TPA: TIGR02266 family protein [Polyangiaceae bacterium]
MTQDTRKDPRAKVLTMTVRYKSATLDEFIEHHSYDVSRGGMFIKTPSPFPPGTLLKFEVKISGEQRVMQGVGRVVWKRESSEVSDARPAGMGVKFIKIDDESRRVIDQLVAARGDSTSAFEQGGDGAAPTRPDASSRAVDASATPKPQVVAPGLRAPLDPNAVLNKPRKATMIGLGAMHAEPESPETAAAEAFFPKSHPELDMPAPEDRTVMKQAAELLQDALREAGGSLEDVGTAKEPNPDPPKVEPKPEPVKSDPPAVAKSEARAADAPQKSVIVNARPRDEVTQPAVRRTSVAPAARKSEPPRARSAALQEAAGAAADSGGGGRMVFALIAVAAAVGVVYFLTKPEPESVQAPEPPPVVEPEPTGTVEFLRRRQRELRGDD